MNPFFLVSVLTAFRGLGRNLLRAGLAILGVAIGVAVLIITSSIGQGARATISSEMGTMMWTNVIVVMPGTTNKTGARGTQGLAVNLTIEDAKELEKIDSLLSNVCMRRRDPSQVVFKNQNWNVPVNGVSPSCLTLFRWSLSNGESISQMDVDAASRVAVLGQSVVENLFDLDEDPIGAIIRIKNVPFRVIGVLSPKGSTAEGDDADNVIYVPFSSAQRKVYGGMFLNTVERIFVTTHRPEDIPEAVEQIRQTIRIKHRLEPNEADDFTVMMPLELMNVSEGTNRTMGSILIGVATISLLVGGIGIMNIVLVSVAERTCEIGVRVAVGARRGHILVQFLIEAMILSVLGGLVGIAVGILGALVITIVAGWPTIITAESIGTALFFSLIIGLFSGLYPSNKAARLNPIDALRYE